MINLKYTIFSIHLLAIATTSRSESSLVACVSRIITHEDVLCAVTHSLPKEEKYNLFLNKKIKINYLPPKVNGVTYAKYVLFNEKETHNIPRTLVYPALFRIPKPKYGESNWASPGRDGCFALGCRWMIFFRLSNIPPKEQQVINWGIEREPKEIPLSPPYDDTIPFLIELADLECGMFQIKADPLDNRLGVDLELLYEDLQLIISHRPDWPSVPAGQLQTDFAKAVLARLLEQAARPEQSNSEHSEVGRQAAE
jgi:hypothetical protein